MKKILNINVKKIFGSIITVFLIFSLFFSAASSTDSTENELDSNKTDRSYTHTAFVQVGTATWCPSCPSSNTGWHNAYESGNYDFEYCEIVVDKPNGGVADVYMSNFYNLAWLPTSYYDGGYDVVVGSAGLTAHLDTTGERTVYDIDADITSCQWLGQEQISVDISVTNNEATKYTGFIRVLVLEEESPRWNDDAGNPYYHAFLDFVIPNTAITILAGETYTNGAVWDGSSFNNPDLDENNIQVILAVFNDDFHTGYSDPPSGDPFTAYYVDEATSAHPSISTPPEILNIEPNPIIQEVNGWVNISCDVIATFDLNNVNVILTNPDLSIDNLTMTNIIGTDTYYHNTTYPDSGLYDFYIWAKDENNNQNISENHMFIIGSLTTIADLYNNWNFISIPFNQTTNKTDLLIKYNGSDYTWDDATDPMNLFIDPVIFGWNRTTQTYEYMFGDDINLKSGHGYWIFAYEPCELLTQNLSGISSDNYITEIKQNWNGLGIPSYQQLSLGNLNISYDGLYYNWSEATDPGNLIVDPVVFFWNSSIQTYQYLVDVSALINPGSGYWIYAYYDCMIYSS